MNLNKENGITIVALIITVIIMIILASVGIEIGTNSIEKAKFEDIKTNMLSIKTKAKTIGEKHSFGDIESLVGEQLEQVPSEFGEGISAENLYKWNDEVLQEQGLGTIKSNENSYYIVSYEPEEVYYYPGIKYDGQTYYSLTQMQEVE